MQPDTFARLGRPGRVPRGSMRGQPTWHGAAAGCRDLIGLIIEATGLQVEVGEVCLVGERPRPPDRCATEVVGFRGGRTLLMPLGELHGIGPGTIVHPDRRAVSRRASATPCSGA